MKREYGTSEEEKARRKTELKKLRSKAGWSAVEAERQLMNVDPTLEIHGKLANCEQNGCSKDRFEHIKSIYKQIENDAKRRQAAVPGSQISKVSESFSVVKARDEKKTRIASPGKKEKEILGPQTQVAPTLSLVPAIIVDDATAILKGAHPALRRGLVNLASVKNLTPDNVESVLEDLIRRALTEDNRTHGKADAVLKQFQLLKSVLGDAFEQV